jgi:hypothetical protein
LYGDINERLKFNAPCYRCGTVLLLSLGINSLKVGKNHSALSTLFLLRRRLPALRWLFQQLANAVSAKVYDVALPRDPAAVSVRKFLLLFALPRLEPKSKFLKNYNITMKHEMN